MSAGNPLIMVVEDDAMLLLAYEMAIEDAGWQHVTATSLEEGLALDRPEVDAAILDIRLGGERVFPLAQILSDEGVPFLFCSGTADDMPCDRFAGVPMLHKPIAAAAVVRAVGELFGGRDETA